MRTPPNRRPLSPLRTLKSKISNPKSQIRSRRPLFETLENRSLLAGLVFPNDPEFHSQWPLHNTGQTGGLNDADIDMPEAWTVSTGSIATVVAILDTGVDYTDADLYLNIWLNEGEIPSGFAANLVDTDSDGFMTFRDLNAAANASFVTDLNGNGYVDGGDLLADTRWENGLDEDGNGKVDDLIGWDFHDNDNEPQATLEDHGTRMARYIGATTDNGLGSAGINWAVRMIPVRIRPYGGSSTGFLDVNGAAGLDYAVAAGAPISNNSWIGEGLGHNYSQVMYDAISRAQQEGHLFIAAAGNNATDNDVTPLYPASYDLDNVISVTGVDASNQTGGTWNYGLNSVDLGASCEGGTSRASARTAGVAALLKTMHPEWTYAQIKDQILSTVDPLTSLAGKSVTGGRLNAANALGVVQVSISDATALEGDQAAHYRGNFIDGAFYATPTFGPDGNFYTWAHGPNANAILRFQGPYGPSPGEFIDEFVPAGHIQGVRDMAFRDGYLYVGSEYSDVVLRFDATTGAPAGIVGPPQNGVFVAAGSGGINGPHGLSFGPDANGDNIPELYVSGRDSFSVVRYDGVTGQPLGTYVASGSGGLSWPEAITFDPTGNYLYVASTGSNQVLKFNAQTGAYVGVGASSGLQAPKGIKFGPDGLLYVASAGNDRILRFSSAGTYVDDYVPAGAGGMDNLSRLIFGPDGNVYVTTIANRAVLRFGSEQEAVFTVSLAAPSNSVVTVDYATVNGTALAGSDFTAASGTVTFAPGQTSRTILVQTVNDSSIELNKTFSVVLSTLTGSIVGDISGQGTIIDDDTKFYVVNDGATVPTDKTFEYGSGSGTAGENYGLTSGNTAPRGVASTAAGDKVWVVDANKNIYVYGPSGNLLGSWSAGTIVGNPDVQGIATNGADVWIVDAKQDKVYRYTGAASRLSGSQNAASSFSLNSGNKEPKDIVTDGTYLWVVNDSSADKVFKYNLSGGLIGSWGISTASPTGITLEPGNPTSPLWIVDNANDSVYQFAQPASGPSLSGGLLFALNTAAGNTNPQGIADPPVAGGGSEAESASDAALLAFLGDVESSLTVRKRRR